MGISRLHELKSGCKTHIRSRLKTIFHLPLLFPSPVLRSTRAFTCKLLSVSPFALLHIAANLACNSRMWHFV
eukprot:1155813-Pelagomonas_calceolata.AAC.1